MNGIEFAYWLQGYFELMEENYPFTVQQVNSIREHLTLAEQNDPNDVFLSLMEGLLTGFSMITDNCADWNENCVREMRLWLTSRIENSVKAQFEKVTTDKLISEGLADTLDPLVSPNIFINPFQTCSFGGGGRTFC